MKNQVSIGLLFEKEAVIELNTDSLKSLNSGYISTTFSVTIEITRQITTTGITLE